MTATVTGISSMATRRLLAEVSSAFEQTGSWKVEIASMGGVDAAREVRAGKLVDVVVLASNVMEKLETEGWIAAGTRLDIASSRIAVAVRSGSSRPSLASAEDVKEAAMRARTISYSSGPSGDHLKRLFEGWSIADAIADRTVEAPPGVPVAQLVARGDADLGFQQLTELYGVEGIDIVGELPDEIQAITIFTAGVGAKSAQREGARAFITYLGSPPTAAIKQRLGLGPGA